MKWGDLTVKVQGLRAMDFKRSKELRGGKKTAWSDDLLMLHTSTIEERKRGGIVS
jgi:hypothetical protein